MVGGGTSKSRLYLHGQLLFARDGPTKKYLSGKRTQGTVSDFGLQRACHLVHAATIVGLTFSRAMLT